VTAAGWPGPAATPWSDLDCPECNAPPERCRHCCATGQGWAGAVATASCRPCLAELEQRAQAGLAEPIADDAHRKAVEAAVRRGGLDSSSDRPCRGCLKHRFVLLGGGSGHGKINAPGGADAGRGSQPQAQACAFHLICLKQEKRRPRLKQAIDSRSALFAKTLAGQLAGLPETNPAIAC